MTATAQQPSEDPSPPSGTTSATPRRPIFQTETTGDYWSDVRAAFKVRRRSTRAALSCGTADTKTDTLVHQ
jgi:hypothetical protein